jgi:hypothetical protein
VVAAPRRLVREALTCEPPAGGLAYHWNGMTCRRLPRPSNAKAKRGECSRSTKAFRRSRDEPTASVSTEPGDFHDLKRVRG